MHIIISILLNGLAVYISAYLLRGVIVDNFWIAIIAAVVLALVNSFIKPILKFITLPITILTLGLFLLVINALMVLLVDLIVPGFEVAGFGWAVLFSIILWLINLIFEGIR